MQPKTYLLTGAVLAALSVILGAFGAHVVRDLLSESRFETYQTAVFYQTWHALGFMMLGLAACHIRSQLLCWAGYCLLAGILIFSGSLYLLVATDVGWLGAITPIGGLLMITGWALFAGSLRRFNV